MLVVSGSQTGCEVVIAQYDCDPDHPDELGFMEGDKLVVVKRLNQDWWVSSVRILICHAPFTPYVTFTCSKAMLREGLTRLVCFQSITF